MKLLIVSWGDFERWKETKYRFGNKISVGPSTLPILQKAIKPDWTVIVLSDTLGKDFSSLDALREDVRSRVMDFLDRIGAGREVDVIIAPGIGQFSHGTFHGSAMDAYYYILRQLSQILPPNENLEVHFDSTHGLNYITLLTYRAFKELLGIAAITNEVTFTAYNSDPFVPKITRELTINTIEKTRIPPEPLSEPLPGDKHYLKPYSMSWREFVKLKTGLNSLRQIKASKKSLDAWIGSLFFGMPLLFAETFPDESEIEGIIGELSETWESGVEIDGNSVTRKLSYDAGFGVLVKLLFEVKVTKSAKIDVPCSIAKLYTLSKKLFRGSTLERINVELGKIEDMAIKYATAGTFPGWMTLKDFLGFPEANVQIKPRNVLAHAGLEANSVEVCMKEWDTKDIKKTAKEHTFLRYSDETLLRIKEIVSSSLGG
ncbi:CRISPR-associated CARF protein Csx1 [Thermococcus sp.]